MAVVVLAADQVSKSLVLAAHPDPGGSIRLVRNTGASFGVGATHPVLVMLAAAGVIAVVVVLLACTHSRLTTLFLSAVLGGALGNLADRIFRTPAAMLGAQAHSGRWLSTHRA